ncbi:MAG: hypothetical protein ACFFC7_33435 [Candidatus Hermodarchaeota archaeon]
MIGFPEIMISQKQSYTSQVVPRKRMKLCFVAVVAAIFLILMPTLFLAFYPLEANVKITTSTLQGDVGLSNKYRLVTVNAELFNLGQVSRVTVWAEITRLNTQTSYSKSQYVKIGFRESKEVKFDFIFENAMDYSELTHRVWINYIEQD